MAGTLDGAGELTLVFGACTGNTTWQDFTLVVRETVKCGDIFVIDVLDACFCERALLVAQLAFTWVGWIL